MLGRYAERASVEAPSYYFWPQLRLDLVCESLGSGAEHRSYCSSLRVDGERR